MAARGRAVRLQDLEQRIEYVEGDVRDAATVDRACEAEFADLLVKPPAKWKGAWTEAAHLLPKINARLRDQNATPTDETPMLLDELLDDAPRELPAQKG